jgi:hypothetical protein
MLSNVGDRSLDELEELMVRHTQHETRLEEPAIYDSASKISADRRSSAFLESVREL